MNYPKKREDKSFKRVHFIGIGGSGMNGIARIMLSLDYTVSGSDLCDTVITQDLASLGILVTIGHDAAYVVHADVVVVSTAVPQNNVELVAAREAGITILRRAELLAHLSRYYQTIAVSGSHGKTMTSSLVAHLMLSAQLDPTYVIGGRLMNTMAYAHLGKSDWFVLEADESDASFLHYTPTIAVVTNIDNDHLSTYDGDLVRLRKTFAAFLLRLPFYGKAIVCVDGPEMKALLPMVSREIITYGTDPSADVRMINYVQAGQVAHFELIWPALCADPVAFELPCSGRHHALNAVAGLLVAYHCGIDLDAMRAGLARFSGVARRFQSYEAVWQDKSIVMVDDYGHHPTEIHSTLSTLREMYPNRRIVMLFQPHRYSRTHELFDEFVHVLRETDVLYIADIYPASEAPIPGITHHALVSSVRRFHTDAHKISLEEAAEVLVRRIEPDDLMVFQGAGSIGDFALHIRQSADRCDHIAAQLCLSQETLNDG
jgi:UDP-N-acetylmuramate--alanine ligase